MRMPTLGIDEIPAARMSRDLLARRIDEPSPQRPATVCNEWLGKRQTTVGPSARDLRGMNESGLFQYGRICLCDPGSFTTLASASPLSADDAGRAIPQRRARPPPQESG